MGSRGVSSISRKKLNANSSSNSMRNVNEIDPKKFVNKTLEELENESRVLDHERGYILDKNGVPIKGYEGDETGVGIPESNLYIKDATFTHNHPSQTSSVQANYGGTFSIADMLAMARSEWKEMRVSASGKGEYNYIVRRTKNSDSKGFYNQLKNDKPKLEKAMKQIAGKNGDSSTLIRQLYTGYLDNYFKKAAEYYGFEYIKRKKSYNYNR